MRSSERVPAGCNPVSPDIQTTPQLPGSAARPHLESINILSIGREAF